MEFAFPWPQSQGEWLAWSSAAVTTLLGLTMLFAPRLSLRLLLLETRVERPEALAQVRATLAGFHLGLGLVALLLAQPLIYLALGMGWAFTAFGRIVSMLSDRGATLHNWIWLVLEALLAAMPLAFVFGLVA